MKIDKTVSIVFGLFVIVLISVTVFSFFPKVFPNKNSSFQTATSTATLQSTSIFLKKNFTEFDKKLAIKLMDRDGDGRCDACGMDVEICMDSGQLECNMVPNAKFGVLGSTHIHTNFKVYLNNKELFFGEQKYAVKSRFVHVENDIPEEFGKLMHIHATGISLWLFFESLGMKFDGNCFELDSNENYCNDSQNSLKFYVNGKLNNEFQNYVLQDMDKILISYGSENEAQIQKQLNSITAFV